MNALIAVHKSINKRSSSRMITTHVHGKPPNKLTVLMMVSGRYVFPNFRHNTA